MAVHASLRFEPVGCVATIIAADGHDVHVLEIVAEHSEIVVRRSNHDEHFPDIHGSVVLIGTIPVALTRLEAAAIVELPDGRRRLLGDVTMKPSTAGLVLHLTDATHSIEVRAVCQLPEATTFNGTDEWSANVVIPINKLVEI
jgi:hypothetical protein